MRRLTGRATRRVRAIVLTCVAALAGTVPLGLTSASGAVGVAPDKFDAAVEHLLEEQAPLLEDRWAGTAWRTDGTVVVALTAGDVPPPLARHPKVRVVRQRFSVSRLEAAMHTVTSRLNPLLAPERPPGTPGIWPYSATIETDENVVVVELDPKQAAPKRAAVESALADELAAGTVRIVEKEQPDNQPACANRDDCSQPFRGGTRVYGVNYPGENCTLNFPVKDWMGIRYQATASHCAGTPWRHAGRDIGGTAWTEDAGNHDYKVIWQQNENERAPQNFIYRPNLTATPITTKLVTPSNGYLVHVCHNGINSNEQCATVNAWNTSWQGRGGFGRYTSPMTCRGDSGSPVINPANLRAYGVLTGVTYPAGTPGPCFSNVSTYFTWTVNAENASGYQLLLTDTTETLGPGQIMSSNDRIVSRNGAYVLVMQADGNFVLYGPTGAVWWTGTQGNPGAFAVMQNAGNLVVYRANRTVLFAAPPSQYIGGSRLVIQDDRNVVIYTSIGTPTWSSRTNI